ncbi:MAG: T9SS type A sorting domain-containing protein [Ignavibacteria bacterium]|nr:T9SS type A sorting domain-containing protein [Ignavibacteria bacterium]MBK7577919.1 T9SS type A sorting domain-containing protein [Ignavibacteria bacterium]
MLREFVIFQNCHERPSGVEKFLKASDSARYKPILVLIANSGIRISLNAKYIRDLALQALNVNCSVYLVDIGSGLYNGIDSLCRRSGGFSVRLRSSSDSELQAALTKVFTHAQRTNGCTIEWVSPDHCSSSYRNVTVEASTGATKYMYHVPPTVLPLVRHEPFIVSFPDGVPGVRRDTTIVIIARRGNLTVKGIFSTNDQFTIEPTTFSIAEGDSISLRVAYTRKDREWCYSQFTLNTESCPYEFIVYADAAKDEKRWSPYPVISLMSPKVGDTLGIGETVDLSWVGGDSSEPVRIAYRLGPNIPWTTIADSVVGRSYKWKIPNSPTNVAELRVQPRGQSRRSPAMFQTRVDLTSYSQGVNIDKHGNIYFTGRGYEPFMFGDSAITSSGGAGLIPFAMKLDSMCRIKWLAQHPGILNLRKAAAVDDSGGIHVYGSHPMYKKDSGGWIYNATDSFDLHHWFVDSTGLIRTFTKSGFDNHEDYSDYEGVVSDGSNARYEVTWFQHKTYRGTQEFISPLFGLLVSRANHIGHIDWSFPILQDEGGNVTSRVLVIPDVEGEAFVIIDPYHVIKIGDSVISRENARAGSFYFAKLSTRGQLIWLKRVYVGKGFLDSFTRDPNGGCLFSVRQLGVAEIDGQPFVPPSDSAVRVLHLSSSGQIRSIHRSDYVSNRRLSPLGVFDDGSFLASSTSPDKTHLGVQGKYESMYVLIDSNGVLKRIVDSAGQGTGGYYHNDKMFIEYGNTKSPLRVNDEFDVIPTKSSSGVAWPQFYLAKMPLEYVLNRGVSSPFVIADVGSISTHIRAANISGIPGESVLVKVLIDSVTNRDLLPAQISWTARLRWNSSILYPLELDCRQIGSNCQVEVSGVWDVSDSLLISTPAVVTLGQTDRGKITIDSFAWEPTPLRIRTTTTDGEITVTGLCEDPNVRLLIGTASSFSLAARPNPASTVINIELGLREPLTVSIELINEMGQTVATFVDGQQYVKGLHLIGGDVSTIATGMYFLRVRSAKGTLTSRLAIVR